MTTLTAMLLTFAVAFIGGVMKQADKDFEAKGKKLTASGCKESDLVRQHNIEARMVKRLGL